MNKALLKSQSNYLLFTDGDCIPRADFVEAHLSYREKGYFLSGGHCELPMSISQQITLEDIASQRCFDLKWLRSQGLPWSYKNLKFVAKKWGKESLLNKTTFTTPSWNGGNASGWKEDILKVNGFDERMEYGAEDREMGERLWNLGIQSKQIRYSAICIHLDHARGYVRKEALEKNKRIWSETQFSKKTFSDFGIYK